MITRFASLAHKTRFMFRPAIFRSLLRSPASAILVGLRAAKVRNRSDVASEASNELFIRSIVTVVLLTFVMVTSASAQVTPKKRKPTAEGAAQTVEIRGQVPTPQVVTVRPRAAPDYSRGVLVPAFYDQHFWPSILAPYRVVPTLPSESAHRPPEAAPDTAATSPPPSRE
jgi:hypothetical protein